MNHPCAAAVVKVEDLEVEVSKACLSFLLFMSHIVILFQLMASPTMEGISNTRGKKIALFTLSNLLIIEGHSFP